MLALSRQQQIDKASPQNKLISLFLEAWNRQGAEFDVIDSAASRDGYGLFCRPEEERTRDETRHSRTPPRLLTRTSLALDQTKTDYPRNARQAPPSTSLLTDMTPPQLPRDSLAISDQKPLVFLSQDPALALLVTRLNGFGGCHWVGYGRDGKQEQSNSELLSGCEMLRKGGGNGHEDLKVVCEEDSLRDRY